MSAYKGWVGTGKVATAVGVARQSVDAWLRGGHLGKEGEAWVRVPVGGSNGFAYLVSPEGVKLARAYWRGSPRNPKTERAPKDL